MISLLQNQRILKRFSPSSKNPKQTLARFDISVHRRGKNPKRSSGFTKKASTYPFFIAAIVVLSFIFLSSSLMFSQTRTGAPQKQIALPDETNLSASINQFEFVRTLADERGNSLVSIEGDDNEEPDLPRAYEIKNGDTIYSISKQFNVSIYDLIRTNKITNPRKLKVNESIVVPARDASSGSVGLPRGFVENARSLPDDISIKASVKSGVSPLSTQFSIVTKFDTKSIRYLWDLGNDLYSFDENPKNTYSLPGTYEVFLIVSDTHKNEVVSNKVSIEVKTNEVHRVRIDSTLPRYFTFNQVNDIVELSSFIPENMREKEGDDIKLVQNPEIFKNAGNDKFVSTKPGYTEITASGKNTSYTVHVFVSPFPSKHSFEPEYDWYKTQFATGINGNCGPASVAMAIHWAKGENVAVAKVRQEIGIPYKNGAIDFSDMKKSFSKHGVRTQSIVVEGMDDIKRIVDRGNIAIMLFNTRSIRKAAGSPSSDYVGRYYDDISGHYIVIKGYTLDGKYVIAYDPMPSDWVSNSGRYQDKRTMLGKNRYYPIAQLMTTMSHEIVEILR
jgi:LysM repeat protein